MNRLRFATIGTSTIASLFCDAAEATPEVELVAAYSRDLERAKSFGEPRGARLFFDSLEDLAQCDEIDAVYVASPNALHAQQALQMVRAHKHVLVEKPATIAASDFKMLVEEAKSQGVVVLEAMRTLHDPAFLKIAEEVQALGDVVDATIRFSKISSKIAALAEGKLPSAFNPRLGGGALRDIGIYTVEPAIFMFGKPERVFGCGVTRTIYDAQKNALGVCDLSGQAVLQYPYTTVTLGWGKNYNNHVPSQIASGSKTIMVDALEEPSSYVIQTPKPQTGAYATGDSEAQTFDISEFAFKHSLQAEVMDFAVYTGYADREPFISLDTALEVSMASLEVLDELNQMMGVECFN